MRSFTLKFAPIVTLAVFLLPVVPVAEASGLTSAQVQAILGLLQSFGADASVISNVTAALNGTGGTSAPAPSTSASCVTLSHTLTQGSTDTSTGGEVMKLQNFLGVAGANGYFGPGTLKAVQNWQAAHSVASPGVTGYGIVGPKTRAAIGCI